MALPKDTRGRAPKKGLPSAEELRQLAGELKGGSMGSRSRLNRLREVFDAIDEDGSGAISLDELRALFEHAGMAINESDLKSMIQECSLDGSGEMDFVEFIEAVHHIGRRARAELRSRAEAAAAAGQSAGSPKNGSSSMTVLDAMLNESRRPPAKKPPSRLMDEERKRQRVFIQYAPIVTFQPASVLQKPLARPRPKTAEPDMTDHRDGFRPPSDGLDDQTVVQMRRSDLGDAFPLAAQYTAALLLHAYLEIQPVGVKRPPSGLRKEGTSSNLSSPPKGMQRQPSSKGQLKRGNTKMLGGGGGGARDNSVFVPLETLQRQQAWARLSGFPETPALTGAQWQSVLAQWLQLLEKGSGRASDGETLGKGEGPSLAIINGRPVVTGVKRVHPSERQPSLHGWDVLQLLTLFRVGKLSDLPYADDQMLDTLPLPQVWPSLGNALEMANQAAAAAQSAQQSMVVSRR